MFHFFRKYWRYVFIAFGIIFIVIGSYIYYTNTNTISVVSDKKLVSDKKEDNIIPVNNKSVFVDIKGAVVTPGVYELEENKRVIDVINLAGGLKENASTINLNLSKIVEDEMYIIVYSKEEVESYLNKNENSKEIVCASLECICPNTNNDACINNDNNINEIKTNNKISINNATKEELMTLNGIGESKADAIIKYRQENGKFNNLEDIKNVSGISDNTYEKIKEDISL